jgi:hypothetical protein
MSDDQRAALRRLRGTRSLRTFAETLAASGMPEPPSRQRLSRVEQGATDLSAAEWDALAGALLRTGHTADEVAGLRPVLIEAPPRSTPALRRGQWSRVIEYLPGNRWWQQPNSLMERVVGRQRAHRYRELSERHGIDREWQRTELRRRLELGAAAAGTFRPDARDAVAVDRSSELSVGCAAVELFVLRAHLRNAGPVAWTDRLLYRLGPPVSSSLPFTPTVIAVPDTPPGGRCEIVIPGRAQWFPNLAVISYVMVFPDCSGCLSGRLRCLVDTRRPGHFDHTLPMPPGYRAPPPP